MSAVGPPHRSTWFLEQAFSLSHSDREPEVAMVFMSMW